MLKSELKRAVTMGIETKVESLGNTSRLSPNLRDVAFKELGETDEVRPVQCVPTKTRQFLRHFTQVWKSQIQFEFLRQNYICSVFDWTDCTQIMIQTCTVCHNKNQTFFQRLYTSVKISNQFGFIQILFVKFNLNFRGKTTFVPLLTEHTVLKKWFYPLKALPLHDDWAYPL